MLLNIDDVKLKVKQGSCITIGNFDGLHLGHQALINRSKQLALKNNLDFLLLTFWPHPRQVLRGKNSHQPLSTRSERISLLEKAGVDKICEIEFTSELANLSAEDFIVKYLLPLKLRWLVVGHDFTLGHNREGGIKTLQKLGEKYNFAIDQLDPVLQDNKPVSSSRLRQCLKEGKVGNAAKLLGRQYSIEGYVGYGFKRGRLLGFPTANLEGVQTLIPKPGVYATLAHCNNKTYPAVSNIGYNPTFNGDRLTIENFLLDTNEDLYDKNMQLDFIAHIRDEQKFPSVDKLKAQIANDVGKAHNILSQYINMVK